MCCCSLSLLFQVSSGTPTPLQLACDDPSLLEILLGRQPRPNVSDQHLVCWACRGGNAEAVRQLLDAGCSPDEPCEDGVQTPIQIAIAAGDFSLVKLVGWPFFGPCHRDDFSSLFFPGLSAEFYGDNLAQLCRAGASLSNQVLGIKHQDAGLGATVVSLVSFARHQGHEEIAEYLRRKRQRREQCLSGLSLSQSLVVLAKSAATVHLIEVPWLPPVWAPLLCRFPSV